MTLPTPLDQRRPPILAARADEFRVPASRNHLEDKVSAEQANPSPYRLDRRSFLWAASGAVASAYLADPALATIAATAGPTTAGIEDGPAGNPIITSIYTADPDAFVFDGRLYLDVDRDEAPLGANDFVMREWRIYSTTDLVTWTDHGVRMSLPDFPWANRNAWAPQMIHRDGRFFWYVPVQKASTNSMSIAVAVADSPLGPFTDALGRPLIDNTTPNHSSFDIDPTVLVDDDGQAYIYWGSFSSPRAAKLKPNMIELEQLAPGGAALGPRVAGRVGSALRLNGSTEYVSLPAGVVSGLTGDFTICAWVNPGAVSTWSRVFDFGANTGRYMFLTVNSGGGPRFAITTSGNGAEQRLSGAGQLPLNTWTHLAVTGSGTTGTLYVNGVAVATNPAMTLRPSDLGATANNWIGRSQFADPLLNAAVDDFQIYNRGLDAAEVAALAAGQPGSGNVASYAFDEAGGADVLDASGNGRNATVISPPIVAVTPQGLPGYWEAPYLFKRNGIYYLAYARGNPNTGGNPATIDYATATQPLGPWTYRGRILDTVTNTTTNHAAIVEYQGQWYVVYHNGALPGGGEFRRSVCVDKLFFNDDGTIQKVVQTLGPAALRPVARYTFAEGSGNTAADSSGSGAPPAILVNDPQWISGFLGTGLRLNGNGQYLSLATGLLWNMYDFTISLWVKPAAADTVHIFDFGVGTTTTMYLTGGGAGGPVRFAITTGGPTRERGVNGMAALPVGRWTHVAITKSALVATLYVNGVQVGQNTNLGLYPARLGNTPNNWIGRSQNPADPFFTGDLADLRIHQRGLAGVEVRADLVPGLVNSLKDFIAGQSIGGGVANALQAMLTRVLAFLNRGQHAEAIAMLDNDFASLVNDQRGVHLTDAQATELLQSAALISATIAAGS
ncbi:MAG TPA: LamG-like jellyroll fold domain-containing protein [Candidatus Limnocylindrales bacterium]|nr:LamG-like jellyroll fold domain-containing protein [Candidatus Limnocylindrales bacterium]